MDKMKVQAVDGRMLPTEYGRGFVGYTRTKKKDAEGADVSVPGGHGWNRCGAVEVPNTRYYRQALRRGDIAKADAPKKAAKPGKDE